jgi:hypothetical protein
MFNIKDNMSSVEVWKTVSVSICITINVKGSLAYTLLIT